MIDKKDGIKIDISSTALEKAFDAANSFLSKLITPAIEETGLLLREKVTLWRLKQQVNTLNKAKAYCTKHHISPRAISLKLLVPLLDNAGIEEDEFLQEKWVILLGNMVDSDQNIENNVFPFVLSQVSKNEFIALEKEYKRIELDLSSLDRKIKAMDTMTQPSSVNRPGTQEFIIICYIIYIMLS